MSEPSEPTEPLFSGENPTPTESPAGDSTIFIWGVRAVYTVVIILLVTIVLPKFKASTTTAKNACIANLKQIDGAIQQWALENKKIDADAVEMPAAIKFLKGGVLPTCPEGGAYSPGITIGNKPTCSLGKEMKEGHSLP